MPAVIMRDYRAHHRLTVGANVLSEGRCEVHLDDTFLLLRGERVSRLAYDEVESIRPLPDGVEVTLYPEGLLRIDGMDHALVRPLFLHMSRLRGVRWAYLLRFIGGDLRDSLECQVQLGDEPSREAAVHLYSSGLVGMPFGEDPFQVPLHELAPVELSSDYRLSFSTPRLRVVLWGCEPAALGRFQRAVEAARRSVEEETSGVISEVFPAVAFPQSAQLTGLLLRGKPAPKAAVDSVVPWLWERIEEVIASSPTSRDPYSSLRSRAGEWLWFGLRRLTESEQMGTDAAGSETGPRVAPTQATDPSVASAEPAEREEEPARDFLFWYMAGLTAGERRFLATEVVFPQRGFATYVYRCPEAPDDASAFTAAADTVARAMLALNFFREPLYAPAKEIEAGRFAEYKLALRKLPYLADARRLLVGRVIHTTPQGWQRQLEKLLAQSG